NPTRSGRFLDDFRPMAVRVAQSGMWNSLAQTLSKITAPGVPDFYQGTEIWDFSLVDPDNRRPVDYGRRQSLLDRTRGVLDATESGQPRSVQALDELVRSRADGRIKLYVTAGALRARRADPDPYLRGDYIALPVTGTRAAHVFAFSRALDGRALVTIVPRLT